jgi:tetratricopeptide (TPR) repeat protein
MRWIASLTLLLALAGSVLAAGTDDQYLEIYNQILQADALQQGGHQDMAAVKYRDAQTALERLHAEHPGWNDTVVSFRLGYLAEKVHELAQYLPAGTNAPPAVAPAALTPQQQTAALQEQINSLTAANGQLQEKLKEALSVQPAAVAPGELEKEQARNVLLQKERDLLLVALDQQKAALAAGPAPAPVRSSAAADKLSAELAALKARSSQDAKAAKNQISALKSQLEAAQKMLSDAKSGAATADKSAGELAAVKAQADKDASAAKARIAELKRQVDDSQKALADATSELHSLKSRPADESSAQITAERDKLKKELAAISKELADREAHPEVVPPAPSPAPADNGAVTAENERLRARLAVLEAAPVPYTPEEMAVLNVPATRPPAAVPAPASAPAPMTGVVLTHKAHSIQDLPPGTSGLMADAQRAVMDRDFAQAEEKFGEVLAQDPENVYVLVNLGNAQFAAGKLDDCEKNVGHALALDPNDAGALYLLGILRYRQNKLDEALDALSHSASLNSTNASTQNYLGCVLADKGLRPAAETAFRKSLQLDPDYADAHYNLAFVYATETPPSLALARWHYQKAVDLGHPKSDALEKKLAVGQ